MSEPSDFYFDRRHKRFVYIPTGEAWVIASIKSLFTPEEIAAIKRRPPPPDAGKPSGLRRSRHTW